MKLSRALDVLLVVSILFNCSSDDQTAKPEKVLTTGLQVDINGVTHNLEVQGVALSN